MSESALIVPATADDVAHFARRRWRDEHGRKLYADLANVAPSGVFVAKDEGTPIGIAIPHALEDEWFLSEIFVEPSFQKRGIGWQLLSEAAKEAGDATRSGLLEPSELGGIAFFLRRGVSLQTPVVDVSGAIPHENELARMAAGDYRFQTEPLDPVNHRAAIGQLDREIRGSARPLDHLYFCENGRGFIFRRDEELAGYAYVWPSGRIGPVAAASQTYLVQFFAFALATLRQTFGATWCTAMVPGTNIRIMRAAMRAGLELENVRMFASEGGLLDLSRYVGFHPLLF
ncbi:MAG TPA: GNAT family N-acetyltransferase [Candidatus Baltobacteraceae bacterium]|nr:GNAT family N-acetyltransferase [Candidatus Baltobacteraceae bacterium]